MVKYLTPQNWKVKSLKIRKEPGRVPSAGYHKKSAEKELGHAKFLNAWKTDGTFPKKTPVSVGDKACGLPLQTLTWLAKLQAGSAKITPPKLS